MNISISELKSRLSACLARVRRGETLVITARRKPLVQIVPLPLGTSGIAGVRWNGAKPRQFLEGRGKARLKGNQAARTVLQSRR
ncbi:MAG: type II toxin-antitoxin system Phd/YefM family antitoxin [Gammaproteobacteria bacterium]